MRRISAFCHYIQVRSFAARLDPSVVQKDILYLSVKAGHGGNGIKKYNGVGGNGASIYVRPMPNAHFSNLCERFKNNGAVKGQVGTNSMQVKLIGQHADPVVIDVPMGVECVNADSRMLVARCINSKKAYLIAQGGAGGTQHNQYKGQKGDQLRLAIHFKLTTNIGFVGLPNAGKSTLLKAMAPERHVKIADYPFTTLKPQVFDIKFDEQLPTNYEQDTFYDPDDIFSLSMADLPGIIEGASRNRGRGYAFLKHLEHSEIIIMVIDVHGFKLSNHFDEPFRNALESIAVLNKEMEAYDKNLVKKPMVLVLNKTDLNDGKEKASQVAEKIANAPTEWYQSLPKLIQPENPIKFKAVLQLSAKEGEINELKTTLRQIYSKLHPLENVAGLDEELDEKFGQFTI